MCLLLKLSPRLDQMMRYVCQFISIAIISSWSIVAHVKILVTLLICRYNFERITHNIVVIISGCGHQGSVSITCNIAVIISGCGHQGSVSITCNIVVIISGCDH